MATPSILNAFKASTTDVNPTGSSTDTADAPGQSDIMIHHEKMGKFIDQLKTHHEEMKKMLPKDEGEGDLPRRRVLSPLGGGMK